MEEDMQEQEHSAISEEDYANTIYTVTLSRKLYDALKKLTIESENKCRQYNSTITRGKPEDKERTGRTVKNPDLLSSSFQTIYESIY